MKPKTRATRRSKDAPVRRVPMTAGFYWWRPNPSTHWSMIKLRSIPHLPPHAADDVSHGSFFGRPIKGWAADWPVGEWVRVESPNSGMSDSPSHDSNKKPQD